MVNGVFAGGGVTAKAAPTLREHAFARRSRKPQ
jgi:hypothetical protein